MLAWKPLAKFKRYCYFAFIVLGLLLLSYQTIAQSTVTTSTSSNSIKFAALLNIDGAIGPAVSDFVQRGLQKAVKMGANVAILQIDTPGGLSKSMRSIIKDIIASPIPVISYVAPSGARAASAGTYILYASHIAAMAPGTNLGAATPVNIASPSKPAKNGKKDKAKPTASQLKAINDAKAYIKSLAELRGRNAAWAEKAVTQAESISAAEALKLNVINIVASDIPSLLTQANGKKVSVRGQMQVLQTKGLQVKIIQPDWRSKFLAVITDPSVAYILLMIGVYGLFFEFANPGFIVPGVVGAIAMVLALYAFHLLPINYAGLGLIILGLVFIVAEAFLPSFGALGIGGIISFVIGSIMLLKTNGVGYNLPIQLIIAVAAVTALFFLGVLQLAFRSRRKKVVSGREAMVGQHGVINIRDSKTWVFVMSESWEATSDKPLQEGQKVVVTEIQGLVLKVEPLE